jgi:cold shock CspA family protein
MAARNDADMAAEQFTIHGMVTFIEAVMRAGEGETRRRSTLRHDLEMDVAARKMDTICAKTVDEQVEEEDEKEGFVRCRVVKWLADRGFGFAVLEEGGGQVFVHSAVVVGDDVLRVGSPAMVKVIKDRSRVDEGFKATEAYGPAQWAERARLRRATAAAACARKAAEVNLKMARQAEELVDRPPGLKTFFAKEVDPPAAAGDARKLPAASSRLFGSPAVSGGTRHLQAASGGLFGALAATRGARPPSARSRGLFGSQAATGGARSPTTARAELRRRLEDRKDEVWELYRSLARSGPREEFERECKSRMAGADRWFTKDHTDKEREKILQEFADELKKKVGAEERRKEVRERKKMEQEDLESQGRWKWDSLWKTLRAPTTVLKKDEEEKPESEAPGCETAPAPTGVPDMEAERYDISDKPEDVPVGDSDDEVAQWDEANLNAVQAEYERVEGELVSLECTFTIAVPRLKGDL